jgi:hypothetical protein
MSKTIIEKNMGGEIDGAQYRERRGVQDSGMIWLLPFAGSRERGGAVVVQQSTNQ